MATGTSARSSSRGTWLRYAGAVVIVLAASAVGRQAAPEWYASGGHPYLVIWPAIILAAWVGGLGPGLLATALSLLEILCAIGPFRFEHRPDALAASIFACCGAVVAALTERLHHARRKEARSRQAREEVLAVVAHDLRNPLNTILFAVRVLRRRPDRLGQHLDTIERAGARMERLIRDLVDASVLDAGGTLSIVPEEADAAGLLAEAVAATAGPAAEKSIVLSAQPAVGLPAVKCDRERILQVLGNLLGNAVKFTPAGGRICVRLEARNGSVHFAVADTGPGIRPEEERRVFERHWANGPAHGAGLGLYIARAIVRAHGGELRLASVPGQGTTLYFTLPSRRPRA